MKLYIKILRIKNYLGLKQLKVNFLFFILFNSVLFGQSAKCDISLNVDKLRNIRSTPLGGTYYTMILTNNSATSTSYTLKSENKNLNCQNPDDTNSIDNVELNINFFDENLQPIKEIAIKAGQNLKFFVHITVPTNTKVNKWSCNEIIASSKDCVNYEASTLLKTLVINANED